MVFLEPSCITRFSLPTPPLPPCFNGCDGRKQVSYESTVAHGMMGPRRIRILATLAVVLFCSTWAAGSPNGLGSEANEGCLCHTEDSATSVLFDGLPDAFESNTTYRLTLTLSSPIEAVDGLHQGGFRLLMNDGTLVVNETNVQALDGGWTHTEAGSYQRSWTFDWTSPTNASSKVSFKVQGNAVNGNQAQTGDAWTTWDAVVPGIDYQGDLNPDGGIDGVSNTDRAFLLVGLMAIVGLLWFGRSS